MFENLVTVITCEGTVYLVGQKLWQIACKIIKILMQCYETILYK